MITYTSAEHQILAKSSVVALGTFDGMHLGHLSIINKMLHYGEVNKLTKVVFTFSDIPKHFYKSSTSKIMSNVEKLQWLEQSGVEVVISLPFDDAIKNISHHTFFDYIIKQLKAKAIVIGENFKFGRSALGTAQWLSQKCTEQHCNCIVMPPVTSDGKIISSSTIRELLFNGRIVEANRLLGRRHFVSGIVKVGKQVGQKLGFATANLTICDYMTNIKPGVYITETLLNGNFYQSVSNVGYNPTFEQSDFNLETHILDFNQSLYGEKISVYFEKRLRDELKFEKTENLIAQIKKDVNVTKLYFNKATNQ